MYADDKKYKRIGGIIWHSKWLLPKSKSNTYLLFVCLRFGPTKKQRFVRLQGDVAVKDTASYYCDYEIGTLSEKHGVSWFQFQEILIWEDHWPDQETS